VELEVFNTEPERNTMTEKWCHDVAETVVWDDLTLAQVCRFASYYYGEEISPKNVVERVTAAAVAARKGPDD